MDKDLYITSKQAADIWNISERSVRHYCAAGRVPGAVLDGKTWMISLNAEKPSRQMRHSVKKRIAA